MVCFHQIYSGEESPASKSRKVGNVPNVILVEDGPSVRCVIAPQGLQPTSFLGTRWRGEVQRLSELPAMPFRSIPSNSDFANWRPPRP
jgi:hypothetical protein